MARYRRRRLRYGAPAGILAFIAGWAVISILTPESAFESAPRWQSTLWVYLGTHFINLTTGSLGLEQVQPVSFAELPEYVYVVPWLAVAGGAAYICNEIHATRLQHNVSNALAVGASYFLTGLIAMVVSDIQPSITVLLMMALFAGAGLWLGSSFLGFFSRGIPIIGIASLGTIAAIGILLLLGGIAVLASIWGLVVIAFGSPTLIGAVVGISRRLERQGDRSGAENPRIHALQEILQESWKELLITGIILILLFVGVTGSI